MKLNRQAFLDLVATLTDDTGVFETGSVTGVLLVVTNEKSDVFAQWHLPKTDRGDIQQTFSAVYDSLPPTTTTH